MAWKGMVTKTSRVDYTGSLPGKPLKSAEVVAESEGKLSWEIEEEGDEYDTTPWPAAVARAYVCLVNVNTKCFPRNRKELFPDGVNLIEKVSTKYTTVDSVMCHPNFLHPLKDLDTHFPSCSSATCK